MFGQQPGSDFYRQRADTGGKLSVLKFNISGY